MKTSLLLVLAQASAKPDPSGLPGSTQSEQLVNGLFFYTLLGYMPKKEPEPEPAEAGEPQPAASNAKAPPRDGESLSS